MRPILSEFRGTKIYLATSVIGFLYGAIVFLTLKTGCAKHSLALALDFGSHASILVITSRKSEETLGIKVLKEGRLLGKVTPSLLS